MKIRINQAGSLTQPILTDETKKRCSDLYIRSCNNMDPIKTLDDILSCQDELIDKGELSERNLKRVNVDFPYKNSVNQITWDFDTLSSYTSLSGLNDDDENQELPKLNGTVHLNVYIDDDFLTAIKSKYDTTNLIIDTYYFLDYDKIAVQTIDSTKPNYNPALAIILRSYGYGWDIDNAPNYTGRWFLPKSELTKSTYINESSTNNSTNIVNIGQIFQNVTTVSDKYGIVSEDTTISYTLTSLDELSDFTGLNTIENYSFSGCKNLTSIVIPENVTSLGDYAFISCDNLESISIPSGLKKIGEGTFKNLTKITSISLVNMISSIGKSAFSGCVSLQIDSIPNGITKLEDNVFLGCENVKFSSLPSGLTEIGYAALSGCSNINITTLPTTLQKIDNFSFSDCTGITISKIPENTVYIGSSAFNNCTGIASLTLENQSGDMTILSGAFDSNVNYPIYVGNTEDAWKSYRITQNLIHSSQLSSYGSRLTSLYKQQYLVKIPSEYEMIDYVRSDGQDYLQSGYKMTDNTRFVTDVGIISFPIDKNVVHGSSTIGFYGNNNGISATISGTEKEVVSYEDCFDVHSLELNSVTKSVYCDDSLIFHSDFSMNTDDSDITFFGNETNGGFMGICWMNRIYQNNVLTADFVPVRGISGTDNGKIGFYDVLNNIFIGSENYTSQETTYTPMDESGNNITDESENVIVMM